MAGGSHHLRSRQCRRSDASARCERQGDSGGRIGPNYEKGSYSSCGPEIDILAPGGAGSQGGKGNVLSTYKDSYTGEVGYSHLWGTSMACPHVSGVAALIVSHFGGEGFTAEECKKRLLNGYRPMGGLIPDDQLGDIASDCSMPQPL